MLKVKKARPSFNGIFTTYETFERDQYNENGILMYSKGTIKPWQKVVSVGPFVKNVKEGDLVRVNYAKYAVHKFEENSIKRDIMEDKIVRFDIPYEYIDDKKCMYIQDNDILVIYDEAEEVEYEKKPASDIVIVKDQIIS